MSVYLSSCLVEFMMRRQGQYADSGVNSYVAPQMHHASGQMIDNNSAQFEGRLEAFTPERDNPYLAPKTEGQWRWERDGSRMSNSLNSQMFSEGRLEAHASEAMRTEKSVARNPIHLQPKHMLAFVANSTNTDPWIVDSGAFNQRLGQGGDSARPYFQGQRNDMKMASEKQSNSDTRSQPHNEDMEVGYEDPPSSQTFQGLEQIFLDDIMKLAKEQNDAEDAENNRHREKINAINGQYEEQLAALRARHANRRDEFLRRESCIRQQQYQQGVVDCYPNSSIGPNDPRAYNEFPASAAAAAAADGHRGFDNNERYDSYRERARFLGGSGRDHGFESRGPYPGGRVYDTGSHYY
ncbi:hypothetical protein G4B88_020559 [Cannabis sativa]|uniref:Uncharacterized protein n=1 Tax=Cannabis sativa TaxID=3483 RepID=A0A7J6FU90_CANSA|nr:hypothetical protein G4B88_020559 [Cannabis sativa]